MKFEIRTVTPQLAKSWLSKNVKNRKPRRRKIESLVAEMKTGAWCLTHQAIAFDTDKNLIDGQHRLMAIVQSGVSVEMAVARDVPVSANGGQLKTMDAVDRGAGRSVADQLSIQHGVLNAHHFVTLANTIVSGFVGSDKALTVAQALRYVEIWPQLTRIAGIKGGFKSIHPELKCTPFQGAAACAMHCHPEAAAEFYDRYVTGTNLTEGHPSHTLREYAFNQARAGVQLSRGGGRVRRSLLFRAALEGIRCLVAEEDYLAVDGGEGLKFFRDAMPQRLEQSRRAIGIGLS